MRAMIMDALAEPLEVREVAEPAAPAGGVVVEVYATGLCKSDWHAWVGHDDVALPHVRVTSWPVSSSRSATAWSAGASETASPSPS